MSTSKRFIAKNGVDNNNNTIQNVSDPVNAQDAATKNFSVNASNLSTGTVSSTVLPLATTSDTKAGISSTLLVTPSTLNSVVPYTPVVNPTLDLDFTKQSYRHYSAPDGFVSHPMTPFITFTRSSIATYFDAMGIMQQAPANTPRIDYDPVTGECKGLLIEETRTNLLTYTSNFDNSIWFKSSGTRILGTNCYTAPDGTQTADLISNTVNVGSYFSQSQTLAVSTTYTKSVYVCPTQTNKVFVSTITNNGTEYQTTFDLSTLVISGTNVSTSSIVTLPNGWYRIIHTWTTASSGTNNNGVYYLGAYGVSATLAGFYIWGAQLESGSFPTSYIPSTNTWASRASTATYIDSNGVLQTAASGVARSAAYDYDADGVLRPIGLLLESSATNLVYPSTLTSGGSGFTVTANYAASPDGTTNATRFVWSSFANAYAYASSITNTSGLAYTASVFLKPTSGSQVISLFMGRSDSNSKVMLSINLTTLACTATVSNSGTNTITGVNYSVKKANNGFYRFSLTATHSEAMTALTAGLVANSSTDSASGDILQYGLQLEAGSYATSYIQTTSAQVTRADDTSSSAQVTRSYDYAIVSGSNFTQWCKQYEGSLKVDMETIGTSGSKTIGAWMYIPSSVGFIGINNWSATNIEIRTEGYTIQDVTSTSLTSRTIAAMSYQTNSSKKAVNGTILAEDTSCIIPYVNQLKIGWNGVSNQCALGHIRSVKYYPKALSATELQAMTSQ